jgi:cytochrome P450
VIATDVDPFGDEWVDTPERAYAAIAGQGPVVWCVPRDCWLVVGYAEVQTALRDTTTFTSRHGIGQRHVETIARPNLLTVDPPEHAELRGVMGGIFRAVSVRDLEADTRSRCRHLLAAATRAETFDLVSDIAARLPALVIGGILGMTDVDRIGPAIAAFGTTVDIVEAEKLRALPLRVAFEQLDQAFTELLDQAREDPTHATATTTALIRAIDKGELSQTTALDYCALLFTAGAETTANLIASAALLLLRRDGLRPLRDDPETIPAIVEECLRLEPPLQVVFRTASNDTVLAGTPIGRGERVGLAIVAANRDPTRFHEPDRFDPRRAPNPHLSFAHGVHHCLGSALARQETRIALEELSRALPDLRLAEKRPPARGPRRAARGPAHLIVTNAQRIIGPAHAEGG